VFGAATAALLADGFGTCLEIGPHPVLAAALAECARGADRPATVLASLRRRAPERSCLLETLGKLYVQGAPVAWDALCSPGRLLALPTYLWQREPFWRESHESPQVRRGQVRSTCPGLLG